MRQIEKIAISKIAVIGAGQIGPDILFHFAKAFAEKNAQLVLVDIAETALQNAQKKIEKKIAKGLETGSFSAELAAALKNCISYTSDYSSISNSEIVLEAATESEPIKDKIFKQVEAICGENTIFLSNSSHMQPEVIFKSIKDKSRCLVAHYFFPADRNPVVELVPSADTDKNLVENLLNFYKSIGKKPIVVKSSYGYAVDPIFEGLCQTAILCLEKNLGNEKEIDKVAMETLGLGVGPFTALNLTGGNPITAHGLDEMGKHLMPWFKSPLTLKNAVDSNLPWHTASKGEEINIPAERKEKIAQEFLGAYFSLASYIMDLAIVNIDDLDFACKNSLVINPPFSMMNGFGMEKALKVVSEFCKEHSSFKIPTSLTQAVSAGGWKIKEKQIS
ncbi:MAG: 3-hydroxyacyl-CoA dehydrogenase family protein [Bacteroidetes bacterium]|nr:3-hydroxyacyl-CoA dehydrogenase family protein [Bacteroidota bacterium]